MEGVEAEAEAARRIAAVVAQVAADGAKRARRTGGWWKAGVVAAAALAAMVMAAGVWWMRGAEEAGGGRQTMRAVAAWTAETGEAEEFRRSIQGMTEEPQVVRYAIQRFQADRQTAFTAMMALLDDEGLGQVQESGLLTALANLHTHTLGWMLEHMRRTPEYRSAKLVALALGKMAEDSFKFGKTPDPRIVPALVRIAARGATEGTSVIKRPLQALRNIADYQRLPEANRLATKVLDHAELEGDETDAVSVEYAAILLLASGDALAEEELRARLEHSSSQRIRVILELTLDKYASGTLFVVAGAGRAM